MGFRREQVGAQKALEAQFDAALQGDRLEVWMKRLATHPHPVGSFHGRENAQYLASLFREWGYQVEIEEFRVLFPTPRERSVELLTPGQYTAALQEARLTKGDTLSQTDEPLPPYNAYSIDGDVTGDLVYVNYGLAEDYEELARRGISVAGKIIIARYGKSYRGIKPRLAAERGALGCLLYSDPRGDGYFRGDVWPKGPWRNDRGAQRGSVADITLYPGDPLTPGVAATPNATRLARENARTITQIPVLPLSYADARPLLESLAGPVAPEDWRGALPITYHLGPGPARVHLAVRSDWRLVPAYDVVARLRGLTLPDEWVVRGNHHDAWVNGAKDPVSGLVAMLLEAQAVGELARRGWRPKRTVIYAAWDAEEPGMVGSTEWVEAHADVLTRRTVAYLNTDSTGRGFLQAGGSHSLDRFVFEIARDVRDPETGVSVARRRRSHALVGGNSQERSAAREREWIPMAALGAGSDYMPFLHHLGVTSLNLGFGGEDAGGSYHSIFDSYDHYSRFGDPGFVYGVALAQVCGRAVLRLSEAEVLPLDFVALAEALGTYVNQASDAIDAMRESTSFQDVLIREGHLRAAADPRETFVVPEPEAPVPFVNLSPLRNGVRQVREAAQSWQAAVARWRASDNQLRAEDRDAVNAALMLTERSLARFEGLPDRPWYRNQLYAPDYDTGYGAKALPAVREAIEERDWAEAEAQAEVVGGILETFARNLEAAAGRLAAGSVRTFTRRPDARRQAAEPRPASRYGTR